MADFDSTSGPSYLKVVDWSNKQHLRVILASLVNGIYTLESNRCNPNDALATSWWESFNFQLIEKLVDDRDSSYFGAIFEFKQWSQDSSCPRHVIAFRGTVIKPSTIWQDLKPDSACGINELYKSSRVKTGLKKMNEMVMNNAQPGVQNVWLAGHSLGAAIALLIGKHMVQEKGIYLETYLFNPPFISPSIDFIIPNKTITTSIRIVKYLASAPVSLYFNSKVKKGDSAKLEEANEFEALREWFPHVFVNSKDPVCSEFIGYFEAMRKMEEIGAGKVVTKYSTMKFIWNAVGRDAEVGHLIPCAELIINSKPCRKFKHQFRKTIEILKEAHKIHQWKKVIKLFLKYHTIEQWCVLDLPLECRRCSYIK